MSTTLFDSMIEITAGAIGGNFVGEAMRDASLGVFGNTLAGAIGGYGSVFLLAQLSPTIPISAGESIGSILGQWLIGGLGGAILTALVCVIRVLTRR